MDNYAHGRLPTETRWQPRIFAVNKWLGSAKLRTQPARAAFNPAQVVNIDWRAASSAVLRIRYVSGRPIQSDCHSGNLRRVLVVASAAPFGPSALMLNW
jgi:hypothetical protein